MAAVLLVLDVMAVAVTAGDCRDPRGAASAGGGAPRWVGVAFLALGTFQVVHVIA